MGDDRTDLPEGTDMVIDGAATATPASATENNLVTDSKVRAPRGGSTDLRQRIRHGGEKLSNEATDRARGFVSQGLERSAEALSNVSKLVGDTATGLDERLGQEYGDYARKAATALERTATSLGNKDPDELIEDTRTFVRNSPGVALAGAAVVGFVLARLLKSGLGAASEDDRDDRA